MHHLTNHQGRNLILHLQGLTRPPHLAFKDDELAELIRQMGFVQMDSIPWVERAHHMILFSRNQTYRTQHLKKLHEKDKQLFENWTHDASLIPSAFWPYWKQKFRRDEAGLKSRFTRWQGDGFIQKTEALRERVRKNGILRSRDLDKPAGQKLEMWQWHDGKAALEYMWRTGQLAVPRREGFQKTYDLCHRVIHQDHYHSEVTHDEFVDWACRSALDRLGFGSPGDIARFWDLLSIDEVKDWLDERSSQETVRVSVETSDGSRPKEFYGRNDLATIVGQLSTAPDRIRMLSPFDPVIRDRKRLKWLFGFEYTIEIYVPPEKRKYGYYVFPLLERDKLIGRADVQAKRADDCLVASKIWLEPGVKWSQSRDQKFQAELVRQARLCRLSMTDWHADRVFDHAA